MTRVTPSTHPANRTSRGGAALIAVCALAVLLLAAVPAQAQPRASVTGKTTVGATLTAKATGGTLRGQTWQACAVQPTGRTCPAASLRRLGAARTYVPVAADAGAWVRVQARIRIRSGATRTVPSAWRGPITAQGGGGGGEGGGARVGRYYCPPWGGAGISYTAILSASEYKSRSGTGAYRLTDGASLPGGKTFAYTSGPYADGWINEYYPEGTLDYLGVPSKIPYIRLGLDPSQMKDRGYGWYCEWEQADPTYPPGW